MYATTQPPFSIILQAAACGMAVCFLLCLGLISTQKWHGRYTSDSCLGIQKFHTTPTPRIGGLPIFLGIISGAYILSHSTSSSLLFSLLIAGIPALFFGLLEDVTKNVSIGVRLTATMASGIFAWHLTDYSLMRVNVWGIDWLLQIKIVSVLMTAFAIGGIANSINIIDGFNGLASLTSVFAFIGYGILAWQVGDYDILFAASVISSSIAGFFLINWPFGKIFLGDGGSYFIGYLLGFVAVILISRNHNISAFAALLICIHPVTEVLFSIYRRKYKKLHPGHPDRLHLHSLIKQRYIKRFMSNHSQRRKNSVTGILTSFLSIPPILLANFVFDKNILSAISVFLFSLLYVALYLRIIRHKLF